MGLAKQSNITKEKGDSFLTCLDACVTIRTLSGLPTGEANAYLPEIADALNKILNVRLEDIPEDLTVPYFELKAVVAEALGMGISYENYGSSAWAKV